MANLSLEDAKRVATILGVADGLTIVLGLLMGLRGHPGVLFPAALSAGIAELVGMAAAVWLSSSRTLSNFLAAMACGVSTAIACVIPAIPFLFLGAAPALCCALGLSAVIGGIVCWLRPERGWFSIIETYGVLMLAAILCFLASLVH